MCSTQWDVQKFKKLNMLRNAKGESKRAKFNIFLQVRFSNKTHISKDQIKMFHLL